MKNILVTGANGFIGTNLSVHLRQKGQYRILLFDIMNSIHDLNTFIEQADFIFHLAGVNRPETEDDFFKGNTELTEFIVDYLVKNAKNTPILFSSSIQAELENPYGKSKRLAENALFNYRNAGGIVYIYRLVNVFGKWCKPNYNSVVATFCYNIARGREISISDPNNVLELVYIDDVINEFISILNSENIETKKYYHIPTSYKLTLGELVDRLKSIQAERKTSIMPDLSDELTKKLFATYISYLPEDKFEHEIELKKDNRGFLFELIKSKQFGQIFISKTLPGITRGNHYHHTKFEKFCVIQGSAEIKFRHLVTNRIILYKVLGEDPKVIDIPTGYTHFIKNVGTDIVITLFWASEIFDTNKPDTYFEGV